MTRFLVVLLTLVMALVALLASPPSPSRADTPTAPTGVSAAVVDGNDVRITWDQPAYTGHSYSAIRWSADPNLPQANWTRIVTGGPANDGNWTGTEGFHMDQPLGATRYYYVTHISVEGFISERSPVVSATIPNTDPNAGPPPAPTNVAATVAGDDVTITYSHGTGYTDYAYSAVRTDNGNASLSQDNFIRLPGDHTDDQVEHLNLSPGTYRYYVTNVDTGGLISARSPVVSATVQQSTTRPPAIWGTGFEDGNSDEYSAVRTEGSGVNATRAVVTGEARTGTRSLRVTIPGSTTAGGVGRYQLVSSMARDSKGADRWYGFSYKMADNWNLNQIAEGGNYFLQMFGFRWWGTTNNGPGNNLDGIGSVGSPRFATYVNLTGDTSGQTNFQDLGAVVKNQWVDWVFHIKWSLGSDGVREVWRNGVKMADYRGRTMLYDLPFEHRIGIYQGSQVNHTRTFYIDNHRVGSSYAAVDPSL